MLKKMTILVKNLVYVLLKKLKLKYKCNMMYNRNGKYFSKYHKRALQETFQAYWAVLKLKLYQFNMLLPCLAYNYLIEVH